MELIDGFEPAAYPDETMSETPFVPFERTRQQIVGEPITVSAREKWREELRISITQRTGEDAPRVDIRYFTVRSDGDAKPHRGGLRLTFEEAAQLRDALDKLDL